MSDYDYMLTFTGRHFRFDAFQPDDFDIRDIAHALSNVARFNGHTLTHYSVAQHSVFVSNLCLPEDAREGLMHDAPEAYMGDMVGPLKRLAVMHQFRVMEDRMWRALASKYRLRQQIPNSVKDADKTMLEAELNHFRYYTLRSSDDFTIPILSPVDAEFEFMKRAKELGLV